MLSIEICHFDFSTDSNACRLRLERLLVEWNSFVTAVNFWITLEHFRIKSWDEPHCRTLSVQLADDHHANIRNLHRTTTYLAVRLSTVWTQSPYQWLFQFESYHTPLCSAGAPRRSISDSSVVQCTMRIFFLKKSEIAHVIQPTIQLPTTQGIQNLHPTMELILCFGLTQGFCWSRSPANRSKWAGWMLFIFLSLRLSLSTKCGSLDRIRVAASDKRLW